MAYISALSLLPDTEYISIVYCCLDVNYLNKILFNQFLSSLNFSLRMILLKLQAFVLM